MSIKNISAKNLLIIPALAVVALYGVNFTQAHAADTWAQTNKLVVTATDNVDVTGYYKTRVDSSTSPAPAAPAATATGWQTSNQIEVNQNGYYYVWAKDAAGNVSLSKTASVTQVDTTNPTIVSVTPSTTSPTNSNVVLTVNATDANAGIKEYSFNGGTTWQTGNTFSVPSNQTFAANSIQVKDNAGNIAQHPTAISISNIDKTKPLVTQTTVSSAWSSKNTITVVGNDDVTHFIYVRTEAGGTPTPPTAAATGWKAATTFETTKKRATFDVAQNGDYHLYAKDAAGNVSDTNATNGKVSVTKVDTVAPTITKVDYSPKTQTNDPVVITVTASDTGGSDGKQYSFDGGLNWQPENTFSVDANKTFPVDSIRVRDAALNETKHGEAITINNIDTEKPIITNIEVVVG